MLHVNGKIQWVPIAISVGSLVVSLGAFTQSYFMSKISQRAYVSVSQVKSLRTANSQMVCEIRVRNLGNTPAYDLQFTGKSTRLKADRFPGLGIQANLGPKEEATYQVAFNYDIVSGLPRASRVYAKLQYRDIFGETHLETVKIDVPQQ